MSIKKKSNKSDSIKDDVSRLLKDIEKNGEILASQGREITKSGQWLRDISQTFTTIFNEPRNADKVQALIPGLTQLNLQAAK